MPQSRQLAAIMFTDIVGYTSMMQKNELTAVAVIKHYNASLEKWVKEFNGQVLNYYGDGSLCTFPSATDAVNCSLAIQKELKIEPAVPLRIGLHIGEVFFEDSKALGDGVNVASRIQSLGQENTILISAEIHDKIKNNASITSKSLGYFDFKNVDRPLEVFALTNYGLVVPQRKRMQGKLEEKKFLKRYAIAALFFILFVASAFIIYETFFSYSKFTGKEKSIAVLPLSNMSADKENEYFSDGITEEIITQLSQISDLKVIARTSSALFKNSDKSIRQIATELGVASILEGSVQRAGNKVRITVQLVDANTQEHIWADKFDRNLQDIFAIQSEVANQIVTKLEAKLFSEEKKELGKKETENLEAYNAYLKGRYYLNKGSEDDLKKALHYFGQAVETDSDYAKAYSGLADTWLMLGEFEFRPGIEVWPKAEEIAKKALILDETLSDAHVTLGHLSIHLFDWPAAEQELTRAIELNPRNAEAHHFYSQYLANMGDMDRSMSEALLSLELDPLSLLVSSTVGLQYYRARRWEEAEAQFKQTLEMHPDYLRARRNLGRVYLAKGMHREAIAEIEKSVALAKKNPVALGYLGHAYGLTGDKEKAFSIINQLMTMPGKKYNSGEIAMVYIGLGDNNKAFEWLNKASDELSTILLHIKVDWVYDPIRSDPRFSLLLHKMGLRE